MATAVFLSVFPFCLALAAFTDFFSMTIPNRIPLALIVAFAVAVAVAGVPLSVIGLHLAAGGLVFLACLVMFAMGAMGGGDAKLLTACALWFGMEHSLLEFAVLVSVMGGALTLAIIHLRNQSDIIAMVGLRLPSSFLVEKKIPYGIAIAIGGFMAFPFASLTQTVISTINTY